MREAAGTDSASAEGEAAAEAATAATATAGPSVVETGAGDQAAPRKTQPF